MRSDWRGLVDKHPASDTARKHPIVSAEQLRVDRRVQRAGAVSEPGDLLRPQPWRAGWRYSQLRFRVKDERAPRGRPGPTQNPGRRDPGIDSPHAIRLVRSERARVVGHGRQHVRVPARERRCPIDQPLEARATIDDRLRDQERVSPPDTLIARDREGAQRLNPERLRLLEHAPPACGRVLHQELARSSRPWVLPLVRRCEQPSRMRHERHRLGVVRHTGFGVGRQTLPYSRNVDSARRAGTREARSSATRAGKACSDEPSPREARPESAASPRRLWHDSSVRHHA